MENPSDIKNVADGRDVLALTLPPITALLDA